MADLTFNVNVELPAYVIQTYMFSGVNSDISGYESMPILTAYTAGALATKTTNVGTTATLMEEFATDLGYPAVTTLPAGIYTIHFDTQKASGSNNYYCYAEVYKRTSGGTETLLSTSDNTTQVAINTVVSQTVAAVLTTNTTILSTDRIVVKIYGVMLSASANIDIRYDNNTDARLEMPLIFDFSSIQAQLNSRVEIVYSKVTDSATHTGSTANTLVDSFEIPANTFTVGDIPRLSIRCVFTGTAGNKTIRLYYNTADTLAGATLFATSQGTSATLSIDMSRMFAIKSTTNTQTYQAAASSSAGDFNAGGAPAEVSVDWTAPVFIIIAVQLGNSTDTAVVSMIKLTT